MLDLLYLSLFEPLLTFFQGRFLATGVPETGPGYFSLHIDDNRRVSRIVCLSKKVREGLGYMITLNLAVPDSQLRQPLLNTRTGDKQPSLTIR